MHGGSTSLPLEFDFEAFCVDLGRYTQADWLDQARALFALFPDVDRAYLERRIRYESAGDHGLEILTP